MSVRRLHVVDWVKKKEFSFKGGARLCRKSFALGRGGMVGSEGDVGSCSPQPGVEDRPLRALCKEKPERGNLHSGVS